MKSWHNEFWPWNLESPDRWIKSWSNWKTWRSWKTAIVRSRIMIFSDKKKLIMKNCLPSSCHHIDSKCVIKKPNRKKDLSFFFGLRPDISRSFFSFMFRFSIVFCLVTSMSTVCSTILRNSTVTAHPHKPAAQPLIRRASCYEKKMPRQH